MNIVPRNMGNSTNCNNENRHIAFNKLNKEYVMNDSLISSLDTCIDTVYEITGHKRVKVSDIQIYVSDD